MNLEAIDRNIFIFLNRYHHPILDNFMFGIRDLILWIPLALLGIYVYFRYKENKSRPHTLTKTIIFTTFIILQIILCTSILPQLIDPLIHRERPLHDPQILGLIVFKNFYLEDVTGFYSAKICAFAAIAVFFISFKAAKIWLKILLIFWIIFISYNRIYIGAYFPFNILISLLLGVGIGMLTYYYYHYLNKHVMVI